MTNIGQWAKLHQIQSENPNSFLAIWFAGFIGGRIPNNATAAMDLLSPQENLALYDNKRLQVHAIIIASANSMQSDLGCTSRIYLDNVTMTLHNVTLASQKPCHHNNKCECSKQTVYVCLLLLFFSIKYRYLLIKILVNRKIDFNRAEPTCYRTNFPYASSGWQNGAFLYIVLCLHGFFDI